MKKNLLKTLSLTLSLLLMVGMLTACGNVDEGTPVVDEETPTTSEGQETPDSEDANAEESDSDTAAAAISYDEHEEFSLWLPAFTSEYYVSYSDNPVVTYLNEKFNVTLNIEQPSQGTEIDALSLMFGTGEYTDMVNVQQYPGSITELYEDGVIIDIAEYLEYMPNLQALIDTNEDDRKRLFDDEGRILALPGLQAEPAMVWGGLMYRRDILETMTDGNVQFPSGNDEPITLEDWDYMLPIFDDYFKQQGAVEYAGLILPYNGVFGYGDINGYFGFNGNIYYQEDDVIKHGLLDEGLYDYLAKMNEWYEAGYIYQDFASRVNDMFFMPNSALTYGGTAAIWYGLSGQFGDNMAEGFDVRPLANPLVEGVPQESLINRYQAAADGAGPLGHVITNACENIPKLLSIIDFMYGEEGSLLHKYGLRADQIPESDTVMAALDLQDGTYWYEEDGTTVVLNPLMDAAGGPLLAGDLCGQRLPGLNQNSQDRQNQPSLAAADAVWAKYEGGSKHLMPTSLFFPTEEEQRMTEITVTVRDYCESMIPQFIMGTQPVTEENVAAFVEQVKAYGLEEGIDIQQAAYDRYLAR